MRGWIRVRVVEVSKMMHTMLALAALLQSGGLLAKWFPQTTGANALEDYLRAADAISTGSFGALYAWKPGDGLAPEFPIVPVAARRAASVLAQPTAAERRALEERLSKGDFAEVCAMELEDFAAALSYIRSGNGKSVQAA